MLNPRHLASCLGIAVWVTATASAAAEVYKCAGERGVPVYQEMPCGSAKELRNFQTDPPEITILPAQRGVAPPPPPDTVKSAPPKNAKVEKEAKPAKGAGGGDASERLHLRLGMTESEVIARLGSPDMTVGAKNAPSPRWTYMPAPGDPETITTLMFTKGVLVDIERKIVKK